MSQNIDIINGVETINLASCEQASPSPNESHHTFGDEEALHAGNLEDISLTNECKLVNVR